MPWHHWENWQNVETRPCPLICLIHKAAAMSQFLASLLYWEDIESYCVVLYSCSYVYGNILSKSASILLEFPCYPLIFYSRPSSFPCHMMLQGYPQSGDRRRASCVKSVLKKRLCCHLSVLNTLGEIKAWRWRAGLLIVSYFAPKISDHLVTPTPGFSGLV